MKPFSGMGMRFIQCSSCGGVVGVLDFATIAAITTEQDKLLKAMKRKLAAIESALTGVPAKRKK